MAMQVHRERPLDGGDSGAAGGDRRSTAELLSASILELRKLRKELEELRSRAAQPIAIVGASCRFPQGVDNPEAYWQRLSEGRLLSCEVPPLRWDVDSYYSADPDAPGRTVTRTGCFIGDIDRFDAPFFHISPREAASLDPQQRLALELAWEAFENSNELPAASYEKNVGVYVGMVGCEYWARNVIPRREELDEFGLSGNVLSFIPGRISKFFGLYGPSIPVDTACSSGLVALHLACEDIRRGNIEAALVGGVNLSIEPMSTVALSKNGFLSPSGECKPFRQAANGYVRGEAGVFFYLKPLDRAERDGNRILGLIRGTSLRQDGASGGLTIPNGQSQQAVIRSAIKASGLDAEALDYVECSSQGNAMADALELNTLDAVFAGRPQPLPIGTGKHVIGHCEAASGLASLLKVLLSLRKGRLLAAGADEPLTQMVDWKSCRLQLVREHMPWPARPGQPMRAGVSAFGFSGTLAHAVVEEYRAPASAVPVSAAPAVRPLLVCVSARKIGALASTATRLGTHLATQDLSAPAMLERVVATLNSARTRHDFRCTFACESAEALDQQLQRLADPRYCADTAVKRDARGDREVRLYLGAAPSSETSACVPLQQALLRRWPIVGQWLRQVATPGADAAEAGLRADADAMSFVLARLCEYLGLVDGSAPALRLAQARASGDRAARPAPVERAVVSRGLAPIYLFLGPPDDAQRARLAAVPAEDIVVMDPAADLGTLLDTLVRLYRDGAALDLDRVNFAARPPFVDLPTYGFDRVSHWMPVRGTAASASMPAAGPNPEAAKPAAAALGPAARDAALIDSVLTLGERQRKAHMVAFLSDCTARVLGHDAEDIDPHRGFMDLGFTSLTAMSMKVQIESALAIKLNAVALFNIPTIDRLADALVLEVLAAHGTPAVLAPTAEAGPSGGEIDRLLEAELKDLEP